LVLLAAAHMVSRMFKDWGFRWGLIWALLSGAPTFLAIRFGGRQWYRSSPTFSLYAFLRSTHLYSGVSPLMALAFLGIAAFALLAGGLFNLALLIDRPLPPVVSRGYPWSVSGHGSFRGVGRLWEQVTRDLEKSVFRLDGAGVILAVLTIAFFYFGVSK